MVLPSTTVDHDWHGLAVATVKMKIHLAYFPTSSQHRKNVGLQKNSGGDCYKRIQILLFPVCFSAAYDLQQVCIAGQNLSLQVSDEQRARNLVQIVHAATFCLTSDGG